MMKQLESSPQVVSAQLLQQTRPQVARLGKVLRMVLAALLIQKPLVLEAPLVLELCPDLGDIAGGSLQSLLQMHGA